MNHCKAMSRVDDVQIEQVFVVGLCPQVLNDRIDKLAQHGAAKTKREYAVKELVMLPCRDHRLLEILIADFQGDFVERTASALWRREVAASLKKAGCTPGLEHIEHILARSDVLDAHRLSRRLRDVLDVLSLVEARPDKGGYRIQMEQSLPILVEQDTFVIDGKELDFRCRAT